MFINKHWIKYKYETTEAVKVLASRDHGLRRPDGRQLQHSNPRVTADRKDLPAVIMASDDQTEDNYNTVVLE